MPKSASTAVLTASLRHNRRFRVLVGGSTVSMLGSRLTTIAYPMLMLWLTRSPIYTGFAVCAVSAPSILVYIPAGMLVDRWDPRRTMLVAESWRAVAMTMIVVTVLFSRSSVLLIIGLAVIEEILEVFAGLGERRYILAIVEPQHACSAFVRTEARTHVAVLAGRPLGGFLFEVNPVLPFLADTFSFIISVITLYTLRGGPRYKPVSVRSSKSGREFFAYSKREIFTGIKLVAKDNFARYAMPLSLVLTLMSQALVIIFISGADARRVSSVEIGLVLAASGLGGAFGALAGAHVIFFRKYSRLVLQWIIWTGSLFALWIAITCGYVWFMAIVMVTQSFMGAMSNIELDTHVAQRADDALARVTSIGRLSSSAACTIGPAAGGLLAGTLGTQVAVLLLFTVTLPITVTCYLIPSVRLAPVSLITGSSDWAWATRCASACRTLVALTVLVVSSGGIMLAWVKLMITSLCARLVLQALICVGPLFVLWSAMRSGGTWFIAAAVVVMLLLGTMNIDLNSTVQQSDKAPARWNAIGRISSSVVCVLEPVGGGLLVGTRGTRDAVLVSILVALLLAWSAGPLLFSRLWALSLATGSAIAEWSVCGQLVHRGHKAIGYGWLLCRRRPTVLDTADSEFRPAIVTPSQRLYPCEAAVPANNGSGAVSPFNVTWSARALVLARIDPRVVNSSGEIPEPESVATGPGTPSLSGSSVPLRAVVLAAPWLPAYLIERYEKASELGARQPPPGPRLVHERGCARLSTRR